MKIYNPKPIHIIRVNIKRSTEAFEHINFCESSIHEIISFVKDALISGNAAYPFVKGTKITIEVREAEGARNGKSKSITFYSDKSSKQILECIESHCEKQNIKNWI